MYYDPMIAKLIAHGKTRAEAIARMASALDAYVVRGVNHNISFLAAIMHHKRFQDGRLTTGFIAEEFKGGFTGNNPNAATRATLVAVAATLYRRTREREIGVSGQLKGHEAKIADAVVVRLAGDETEAVLSHVAGIYRVVTAQGTTEIATAWQPGATLFEAVVDGANLCVQVDRAGSGWRLFHAGCLVDALVLGRRAAELNRLMPARRIADTSRFLLSPMPGLLKNIAVRAGQEIKTGEELCTVEAMKMENVLRAERDGTVAKLHAAAGDSLAVDQKIVEFA
jgi:propionyl-CoA carboxylase alpha chain